MTSNSMIILDEVNIFFSIKSIYSKGKARNPGILNFTRFPWIPRIPLDSLEFQGFPRIL